MRFDLVRPCKDCPFRSDIPGYLTVERVRQIVNDITHRQATFSCHKTNTFRDGETIETKESQHCAGAMIFLERIERPNQLMRIAERFGSYDHKRLDMDSPVFKTGREMELAQPRRRRNGRSHR